MNVPFHWVRRSIHSPSKKSWTHAYGIYATSMDLLFEPPVAFTFNSHQIHIGKWQLGWVLNLYTLGFKSLTHVFNLLKNALMM